MGVRNLLYTNGYSRVPWVLLDMLVPSLALRTAKEAPTASGTCDVKLFCARHVSQLIGLCRLFGRYTNCRISLMCMANAANVLERSRMTIDHPRHIRTLRLPMSQLTGKTRMVNAATVYMLLRAAALLRSTAYHRGISSARQLDTGGNEMVVSEWRSGEHQASCEPWCWYDLDRS